jgi:hypothetical protein
VKNEKWKCPTHCIITGNRIRALKNQQRLCTFQIMDMNNNELEQLARRLGHDAKTYKEYYRLSHSTVQLSKV